MNDALGSAISRVPWDFFATPTYTSRTATGEFLSPPTSLIRERMFFQYIRQVEKAFSVPSGRLLYVGREELGEKNRRPHWHILFAGLYHTVGRGIQPSPNRTSDCHRLRHLWLNHCGKSAGFNVVRPYMARLSGVQYIMKGLEFGDYSSHGANSYEVQKFIEDQEGRKLIVAPSVFRYLALRSRNRRHLEARLIKDGKRDRSTRGIRGSVPTPQGFKHPYAPSY